MSNSRPPLWSRLTNTLRNYATPGAGRKASSAPGVPAAVMGGAYGHQMMSLGAEGRRRQYVYPADQEETSSEDWQGEGKRLNLHFLKGVF